MTCPYTWKEMPTNTINVANDDLSIHVSLMNAADFIAIVSK